MTEYQALLKAVDVLGGQVGMANELSARMNLKIKQGHVYNWLNRGRCLPDKYARYVEAATREKGEEVKASDLCPVAFAETA